MDLSRRTTLFGLLAAAAALRVPLAQAADPELEALQSLSPTQLPLRTTPFLLGEIQYTISKKPPRGWVFLQGQTLHRSDHPLFFAELDMGYSEFSGGDIPFHGDTYPLPDFRGVEGGRLEGPPGSEPAIITNLAMYIGEPIAT